MITLCTPSSEDPRVNAPRRAMRRLATGGFQPFGLITVWVCTPASPTCRASTAGRTCVRVARLPWQRIAVAIDRASQSDQNRVRLPLPPRIDGARERARSPNETAACRCPRSCEPRRVGIARVNIAGLVVRTKTIAKRPIVCYDRPSHKIPVAALTSRECMDTPGIKLLMRASRFFTLTLSLPADGDVVVAITVDSIRH